MANDQDSDTPNEIVAAAKDAKARRAKAAEHGKEHARGPRRGDDWPIAAIGLGVGIGSAAVAAAMLYSNRRGKRES